MKTICYIASGIGLITVLISAAIPHAPYTSISAMIGAVTIYGGFVEAEYLNYAERKRAQAARRKREQQSRRQELKMIEARQSIREMK